jgi:MYXO-CTERM domain-containing protein
MLGWLSDISTLSENGSWVVDTTVDKLFAAVGDCSFTFSTTIWLWLDSTGTGYPDSGVTGTSAPHLGIQLDGTAPEAPSGITVEGSDEALVVSWSPLSTIDWPDLAGYLVFCTRGDDLQVFNPSYFNNQYLTGQMLCSATTPPISTASTNASAAGITTAVEIGAPSIFQTLDRSYLCSGLLPPSQTSLRLGTLQNGILYTVGVAAVDYSGNASPIQSGFVQTPIATGRSGCDCQLTGNDRSAVPWGAMLALGVASRLRRRGKSQRR